MNPPMIVLIILLAAGLVNKCDTENKLVKIQRKMERIEKKQKYDPNSTSGVGVFWDEKPQP